MGSRGTKEVLLVARRPDGTLILSWPFYGQKRPSEQAILAILTSCGVEGRVILHREVYDVAPDGGFVA